MTKKDEGMIKGIEDNLTREKRWNDLFDLFDRKKKKNKFSDDIAYFNLPLSLYKMKNI